MGSVPTTLLSKTNGFTIETDNTGHASQNFFNVIYTYKNDQKEMYQILTVLISRLEAYW